MMRKRDRLRSLQVRIARHHGFNMAARKTDERGSQFTDDPYHLAQFVTQVEAKVERDLVVARARGMQLAPSVADLRDQPALDCEMNILVADIEAKASGVDLALNFLEPALDRTRF